MGYSDLVIEHFFQPQNVGCFNADEPDVYTGQVGAIAVSDMIQLQLQINSLGIITQAKFKAYGNPYTIAALSWLTTKLVMQSLAQARQIDYQFIATHVGIPHQKMPSALLVMEVLRSALDKYVVK